MRDLKISLHQTMHSVFVTEEQSDEGGSGFNLVKLNLPSFDFFKLFKLKRKKHHFQMLITFNFLP